MALSTVLDRCGRHFSKQTTQKTDLSGGEEQPSSMSTLAFTNPHLCTRTRHHKRLICDNSSFMPHFAGTIDHVKFTQCVRSRCRHLCRYAVGISVLFALCNNAAHKNEDPCSFYAVHEKPQVRVINKSHCKKTNKHVWRASHSVQYRQTKVRRVQQLVVRHAGLPFNELRDTSPPYTCMEATSQSLPACCWP